MTSKQATATGLITPRPERRGVISLYSNLRVSV